MSNQNAFVTWATGAGANVLAPAQYAAATIRQLGAQIGIGDPVTFNNAMRQASIIATMIAQFTADYGPSNVNDDGNIATLEAQFLDALQALITAEVQTVTEGQNAFVHYGNADSGTANNYIFTSPTPGVTAYSAGLLLLARVANGCTGPSLINVAGNGFIPITRGDLTPLQKNDIAANEIAVMICDGSRFQLVSVLPAANLPAPTTTITTSGAFTTPNGTNVRVALYRQSFLGNSSTVLPVGAVDGTVVEYADLVGNFQAYPLTVTCPFGQSIASEAPTGFTLNVDRGTWKFTYFAGANVWGVN